MTIQNVKSDKRYKITIKKHMIINQTHSIYYDRFHCHRYQWLVIAKNMTVSISILLGIQYLRIVHRQLHHDTTKYILFVIVFLWLKKKKKKKKMEI